MTADEIKLGHVYRGRDGRTRKVLRIGGRRGLVQYRGEQMSPQMTTLERFAEWAVKDVTPAPTAMAGWGEKT